MQKKKRAAVLLICGVLTLAGCAEPEKETGENFRSEQVEEVTDTNKLLEDQGRFVECTLQTPEELPDIEIQATVTIPETVIEKGEFEQTLPSVEQIEELLTDGEKMVRDDTDEFLESWRIDPDAGSEAAYKMIYSLNPDAHLGHFQNSSVENTVGTLYTEETCPDEETAENMRELTERALAIYEKAGMQIELLDRDIETQNDRCMACVTVKSLMDDVQLVREDYQFVTSSCFIAEEGVSSMTFSGSFVKKNTREVSVMSIDDLLQVLEDEAELGNLNVQGIITEITLAYCVDDDAKTFYPVWYLHGSNGEMSEVCIDARTGKIVPYINVGVWSEEE